jgi:hypothetical protein
LLRKPIAFRKPIAILYAIRNAGLFYKWNIFAITLDGVEKSSTESFSTNIGEMLWGQLLPARRSWGILALCTFSERDFMGLFQRHRTFTHGSTDRLNLQLFALQNGIAIGFLKAIGFRPGPYRTIFGSGANSGIRDRVVFSGS